MIIVHRDIDANIDECVALFTSELDLSDAPNVLCRVIDKKDIN
jgi:hypothetical protein